MNQSETIAELAAALIEAKKKFTGAKKALTANVPTKQGGTYEYKYTDLARVIEATEEALSEQGVVAIQFPRSDISTQTVTVATRLLHRSGQFIEDNLEMPAVGRLGYDAQSVGSAITYARKYALMAFLGIAPEDDDGASASGSAANGSGKEIVRKSEKAQLGITANGEPIFDEDGQPVVVRPASQLTQQLQQSIKQAPSVLRTMPEKQVGIPRGKRFFAIAMNAGRSKDEINDYLGGIGCEKSEEIPVVKYEEACEWAAGQ